MFMRPPRHKYTVDQRRLFWRSLHKSDNNVQRMFAYFNQNQFIAIASKYRIVDNNHITSHSCTGWRCRSGSSLSWLSLYTDVYTRQLSRTLLRNSTSHQMSRPVEVSALLRHHRLLSSALVFPPSAIELFRSLLPDCGTLCPLNGIVNICFQETFEDPSIQSFFPRISCSACAVTLSFRTL